MNVVAVVYPSRMDRTGIGGNRRWVTWGSDLLRFQLCCIEEYRVHLEEQLGNTDRHNWSEREKRGPHPAQGVLGSLQACFPAGSVQCPILVSLTWPGVVGPTGQVSDRKGPGLGLLGRGKAERLTGSDSGARLSAWRDKSCPARQPRGPHWRRGLPGLGWRTKPLCLFQG